MLDRQLINVDGARLVRANEIELAGSRAGGAWSASTPARAAVFGGCVPRRPRRTHRAPGEFLDWASLEPFVGHVPTVRLRIPHPKLARLHPAQIADLVEAASHREGEEIIEAVGADEELEADVFEELDEQHQLEFIEERSDEEVADVLARMAPDDAADSSPSWRRTAASRCSRWSGAAKRAKVRALLGYDPAEAGGLMSPDFVCSYRHATVAEALERVRSTAIPSELLTTVYVDGHAARARRLPCR